MQNIKDIYRANICSFFENIYEHETLDEKDFVKLLRYFLTEDNLEDCLETCVGYTTYNINYVTNICNNNSNLLKYKYTEKENIIRNCEKAFLKTIEKQKTIAIKAFLDNLTKELIINKI